MKKVYVSPEMYVEQFMPNQNVAANCSDELDYPPVFIEKVKSDIDLSTVEIPGKGQNICNGDKKEHGHAVPWTRISGLDQNGDDKVSIFNANECEIVYENYGVVQLGNMLTETSSWNSPQHKMAINGVKIPS